MSIPPDLQELRKEVMTSTEVAAHFGIDPKSVSRWARRGHLRSISVGTPGDCLHLRFLRRDLHTLISDPFDCAPTNLTEALVTPAQVADHFGVTSRTVREWLYRRRLPGFLVLNQWRILRRDVPGMSGEET